ncbi:hypothetical protein DVH24_042602, partial [Malus domestica]
MSLDEKLEMVKDFLIATSAKDLPTKERWDQDAPYNNCILESTNQNFWIYKKTVVSVELLCSKVPEKIRREYFHCPRTRRKYSDGNWGCRSSKDIGKVKEIQKNAMVVKYRSLRRLRRRMRRKTFHTTSK